MLHLYKLTVSSKDEVKMGILERQHWENSLWTDQSSFLLQHVKLSRYTAYCFSIHCIQYGESKLHQILTNRQTEHRKVSLKFYDTILTVSNRSDQLISERCASHCTENVTVLEANVYLILILGNSITLNNRLVWTNSHWNRFSGT